MLDTPTGSNLKLEVAKRTYHVAVIPGDGIGEEVTPATQRVLDAAARHDGGFAFAYEPFLWGAKRTSARGG